MKKSFYVVRILFPTYATNPFRAELTNGQAERIIALLERYKKEGALKDYYVGPPADQEWVHALVLSANCLKVELTDLVETERRMSADR